VVGKAPVGSPGLGDDRREYAEVVRRLWGGSPTTRVGKGRVIAGDDVEKALASLGVAPDFQTNAPPDAEILFLHRRLEDGDAYFLNNRKPRVEKVEARFRVTGKEPEIWRADTGAAEAVTYRTEGGETIVPLEIGPEDSFFVVFRRPASGPSKTVPRPAFKVAATLGQPWSVTFQPGRGAPASLTLQAPRSLSESTDAGVKYFSGTSTWTSTFEAPKAWKAGTPLQLDLGRVGDVAEVRINGTMVGTVWKAPYTLDVGSAVKGGRNTIEVRIANLWVNRLIGDQQPGAAKVAFVTIPTYRVDASLRPSGLIGPVTLSLRAE
jgi:hypothetical protein